MNSLSSWVVPNRETLPTRTYCWLAFRYGDVIEFKINGREILVPGGLYSHSLTRLVVALRVLELLDVFWQQLRPIDFNCQLVELEHVCF